MREKISKFEALGKDEKLLKKYIQSNQKEYVRKRLKTIKLLWDGKSQLSISKTLHCGYASINRWVTTMVEKGLIEGLKELAAPTTFEKKQTLDQEKKAALKKILLTKKPTDFGIDRHIWTGEIIAIVIKKKWKLELKDSRIYMILQEVGLSYQKAHRDYAEADTKKQKAFVKTLKKNI